MCIFWKCFEEAAAREPKTAIELLFRRGPRPTTKDARGWTALHFAASKAYSLLIQLFLENRYEIITEDSDGATVLHLAARDMRVTYDVSRCSLKDTLASNHNLWKSIVDCGRRSICRSELFSSLLSLFDPGYDDQ